MERKILVTQIDGIVMTFLFEDGKAAEIWAEEGPGSVSIDDIYLGVVKNIVPNLDSAFVEYAPGRSGYFPLKGSRIHFADPSLPDKRRGGLPVQGDTVLVQAAREKQGTKEVLFKGNITLPGRYCVLTEDAGICKVSRKIADPVRRAALKALGGERPEYGWTIRTAAENVPDSEILADIDRTAEEYRRIMNELTTRIPYSCIFRGAPAYRKLAERYCSEPDTEIVSDLKEVISGISVPKARKRLYEDAGYPLEKLYSLREALKEALGRTVRLKSGAYIVIDCTEAMTVVDVNTGKSAGRGAKDENFLKVNREAGREVLRQIRLRNLAGIIIVDFINQKDKAGMDELLTYLKELSKADPVQVTVVDFTPLGLVEITRKKIRMPLREQLQG
ncbi:MAG: ribonuclease E/G [Lachnospiraceae bacterium]|nr:ribonuclease E/G [Lachnospiraceae bacterium]